jgi:hypothetical protein
VRCRAIPCDVRQPDAIEPYRVGRGLIQREPTHGMVERHQLGRD